MPAAAPVRIHVLDRNRSYREQKLKWQRAKGAEAKYARQLRGVADQVDRLVRELMPDDSSTLVKLEQALRSYSELLKPWAAAAAGAMINDVSIRDERMWTQLARDMGLSLREEIKRAPTGQLLQDMLAENVKLITSLPTEAGQRVHELALRRLENAERAEGLAADILRTGHVTRSRANLIARTETSRVASGLIEARATHIGCTHYVWRTSEDGTVREDHKKLNGKVFPFSTPPVAGPNGMRYHPGMGPNCRCWPEPIVPETF